MPTSSEAQIAKTVPESKHGIKDSLAAPGQFPSCPFNHQGIGLMADSRPCIRLSIPLTDTYTYTLSRRHPFLFDPSTIHVIHTHLNIACIRVYTCVPSPVAWECLYVRHGRHWGRDKMKFQSDDECPPRSLHQPCVSWGPWQEPICMEDLIEKCDNLARD